MLRFTATVEGVTVLDRAFNRIDEAISDLRFAWPNVAREFYAIMGEQFESEGAQGASGKWKALTPAYKKWKEIHYPGEPILRLTHALVNSLTDFEAPDAIYDPQPLELTIGSKVPYGRKHQRERPIISLTEVSKRRIQKAIQVGLVDLARRQGFGVEGQEAA